MENNNGMKKVLCPVKNDKTDKTFWMRMGTAFTNRDGSMNVYLDAFPTNGKLQIRDMDERDRPGAKRPTNGTLNSQTDAPF